MGSDLRIKVTVYRPSREPGGYTQQFWWCSLAESWPDGVKLHEASGPGEAANPRHRRMVLIPLPAPPGWIDIEAST